MYIQLFHLYVWLRPSRKHLSSEDIPKLRAFVIETALNWRKKAYNFCVIVSNSFIFFEHTVFPREFVRTQALFIFAVHWSRNFQISYHCSISLSPPCRRSTFSQSTNFELVITLVYIELYLADGQNLCITDERWSGSGVAEMFFYSPLT